MFRGISRTLALLLAAAGILLLGTAPAMAGEQEEYPPTDCSVTVDDDTPSAGDTITVSGENWPAGATVTIFVGGVEAGTATAGDDGTWSAQITVPETAGDYEVTANGCGATQNVLGTTISVGAAPQALPATGSSSTEPLVRTGAVLIAAGAVLVYAVRRRSQAAAAS
jgi:hypothetical protein